MQNVRFDCCNISKFPEFNNLEVPDRIPFDQNCFNKFFNVNSLLEEELKENGNGAEETFQQDVVTTPKKQGIGRPNKIKNYTEEKYYEIIKTIITDKFKIIEQELISNKRIDTVINKIIRVIKKIVMTFIKEETTVGYSKSKEPDTILWYLDKAYCKFISFIEKINFQSNIFLYVHIHDGRTDICRIDSQNLRNTLNPTFLKHLLMFTSICWRKKFESAIHGAELDNKLHKALTDQPNNTTKKHAKFIASKNHIFFILFEVLEFIISNEKEGMFEKSLKEIRKVLKEINPEFENI